MPALRPHMAQKEGVHPMTETELPKLPICSLWEQCQGEQDNWSCRRYFKKCPMLYSKEFVAHLESLLNEEIKVENTVHYSNRTEWLFDKIAITYFGRITKENKKLIQGFFKLCKIQFHEYFKEKVLEAFL